MVEYSAPGAAPADLFSPIRWGNGRVYLLDQLRLPHEERWVACTSVEEVAAAIRDMVVRGAPAIGITAAYGMAVASRTVPREKLSASRSTLAATRPTAVNLFWALDRMAKVIEGARHLDDADFLRVVDAEAVAIHREDIAGNERMGRFGAAFVPDGARILTHCNAGALATGGYGTALGVIRAAVNAGKQVSVWADETRPYLQGARLTAWELARDKIPVTIISDNMAGYFFGRREIDLVVVGADRIARNGDTANKIGTYSVAVLAHAHSVPFYVAAPLSTIDRSIADGRAIPIEERSPEEVTHFAGSSIAPAGVPARHPAFDVTPAHLISRIITDAGVAAPPYEQSLAALFR